MENSDVGPPLVDAKASQTDESVASEAPKTKTSSPRSSPRPFNNRQFTMDLERSARKAGSGIGLVLQGRELAVMKSIDRDSRHLRHSLKSSGAPSSLGKTPYLEVHPGIRHAITSGEQAIQDHKHMGDVERRNKQRRMKAQQLLLSKRPSGDFHIPPPSRPQSFDLSDRLVTFGEYVGIRKQFSEYRSAQKKVERHDKKTSAIRLWRDNLSEAHYRTPSPLLRDSYKGTFLSYSLAPRYQPVDGEIQQYL